MNQIRTLFVANRGEIARRVMRTAASMGIRTAVAYSEPDRHAPFVVEADVAVALGGATAAESYLDIDTLLAGAQRVGADAVHPGYGFASENPAFARAVLDAGLIWVGPTPESIEAMGSKLEAKRLAAEAGVPTLPAAEVDPGDPDGVLAAGEVLGFPLLVKASAGGGGKGMRRVDGADELVGAVVGASREAASSFDDATVFLERLVLAPRHIEVQVLGDTHGNLVHLFERECSIQRRHQKVIEEAPSPGVSTELAERMYDAALSLAGRIGYVGAGTVEFVVEGEDFHLLEMNTRLQVEHTVTEEITGIDLVAMQLRVARGEELPFTQDQLMREGHAIQARLYAEDPSAGFVPTTGVLHRWDPVDGPGIRIDDGVTDGSVVSPFYDPMLAKFIAHGTDRAEAAALLARELSGLRATGLRHNRDLLVAVLSHEAFLSGDTTTAFFDDHPEVLGAGPGGALVDAAICAVVAVGAHQRRAADTRWGFAPSGWRNLSSQAQFVELGLALDPSGPDAGAGEDTGSGPDAGVGAGAGADEDRGPDPSPGPGPTVVRYRLGAGGSLDVEVGQRSLCGRVLDVDATGVRLEVNGVHRVLLVDAVDGRWSVSGADGQVDLVEAPRFPAVAAELAGRGPTAPLPGTVVAVEVAAGDQVVNGQVLVVMEAMKMEHRITAPADAAVIEVLVAVGDQVDANDVLVTLDAGLG